MSKLTLSDLRVGLKVGRLELVCNRRIEAIDVVIWKWDCICECGKKVTRNVDSLLRAANRARKSVPSCGPRCKANKNSNWGYRGRGDK